MSAWSDTDSRSFKASILIAVWFACAVLAAAQVHWIFFGGVDHDEVEHLAVAYRIVLGELPFRDFHQNHLPLFWYTLVPFVQHLKATIYPLYIGRCISLSLLLIGYATCLRLLTHVSPLGKLRVAIFTFFVMVLSYELDILRLRPDAYMLCFASIAFYLMATARPEARARVFFIGFFLGLGVSVSIKMALLSLIFPLLVLVIWRRQIISSVVSLVLYGLGFCSALLPLFGYLYANDLIEPFWHQVVVVNGLIGMPWANKFFFVYHIYFSLCMVSIVFTFLRRKQLDEKQVQLFFITSFWILIAYSILFFTSHSSKYHAQVLVFPAALNLTFLFSTLFKHIEELQVKALFAAWVLFHPLMMFLPIIVGGNTLWKELKLDSFKELVALTRGGDKTCIGFAPLHPVYCENVSSIMLGWDVRFLKKLRGTEAQKKFVEAWQATIDAAASGKVDLVVRHSGSAIWEEVLREGVFTQAQYSAFLDRKPGYEVKHFRGQNWKVWIKKEAAEIGAGKSSQKSPQQ